MSSKSAGRVKRNHMRYRGRHELNVVPMIDMMVILVFFLIFSAVFTRTNIIELNIPVPDASATVPEQPEKLQLEVVVRQSTIDVTDRNKGVPKSLPNTPAGYDMHGLSESLHSIKSDHKDSQDASVLLEPDISYDTLIQVMDVVRVYFPEVSVGDAPT